LTTLDVREVLATVEPLVARHLASRGLVADEVDDGTLDPWVDEAPVLAGLAAASVQGRLGLGARPGARPGRLGVAESGGAWPPAGPCQADANGYSLHAGLVIPAGQRARLEQVCRYLVRPSVAGERLQVTGAGQVRLALRHPWRDGTTAFVFDPVAFLGRLAVLVPRPRVNLVLYYGVLGARAAWRRDVVAGVRREGADADGRAGHDHDTTAHADAGVGDGADRGLRWAALMARTFGLDVLACPRCSGRLRLVALIDQAAVIGRILRHLGLPVELPPPRPARAPPLIPDRPIDADWEGDPSVFAPGS
jgi:Putative transposase